MAQPPLDRMQELPPSSQPPAAFISRYNYPPVVLGEATRKPAPTAVRFSATTPPLRVPPRRSMSAESYIPAAEATASAPGPRSHRRTSSVMGQGGITSMDLSSSPAFRQHRRRSSSASHHRTTSIFSLADLPNSSDLFPRAEGEQWESPKTAPDAHGKRRGSLGSAGPGDSMHGSPSLPHGSAGAPRQKQIHKHQSVSIDLGIIDIATRKLVDAAVNRHAKAKGHTSARSADSVLSVKPTSRRQSIPDGASSQFAPAGAVLEDTLRGNRFLGRGPNIIPLHAPTLGPIKFEVGAGESELALFLSEVETYMTSVNQQLQALEVRHRSRLVAWGMRASRV
ncbi:hypothetical protein FISHEDRAFT_74331 [Fistulina hepatica ATCC 64428]|uniref:Uncharacterized protein n=1 Tax=Fistulina hepatica ATCC 64428 TaxID=1128425 RepID=A0A0D7ABN2_9AGAR|nr:hypothetical protein FISHEDRAFT_74331 [Fistulina hepatica ATCC 64428]